MLCKHVNPRSVSMRFFYGSAHERALCLISLTKQLRFRYPFQWSLPWYRVQITSIFASRPSVCRQILLIHFISSSVSSEVFQLSRRHHHTFFDKVINGWFCKRVYFVLPLKYNKMVVMASLIGFLFLFAHRLS